MQWHYSDRFLQKILFLLAFLLLAPALLIHLGLNPFFAVNDEAIRALVALEMYLSGDYVTPTLAGDLYYYKPPFFNWMVVGVSVLSGGFSEWSLRLTSVLSLLGFMALIYYYNRKHFSRSQALLLPLMVLTSGRILFFDSFLGLIDIAHAAVIYWLFMVVYHQYHKSNYRRLFLASYLLAAIAFMMKGFPAIVFQGITLLVFFAYHKDWKRFFSLSHFGGILLFAILIGGYYFIYLRNNALSLPELFAPLFDQSTQRTGVQHGLWKTLTHLFLFPFELLYHFAPWTLLVVFLFRKGLWKEISSRPYLKYISLIFLANILVYWVSPGVFPRYFFMFLPLLFPLFLHFYLIEKEAAKAGTNKGRLFKIFSVFFIVLAGLLLIGIPILPLQEAFENIPHLWLKTLPVWLLLLLVYFLMIRRPQHQLLSLIVILLGFRIIFNFLVLPDRASRQMKYKIGIEGLTEMAEGHSLFIYRDNYLLAESDLFYITNERQEILTRKMADFPSEALYIVDDRQWDPEKFEEVYQYACKWYDRPVRLCKLKQMD